MTKKQLQAKVKRLERKNRQLQRSRATLLQSLHYSVLISKELARMIPMPNYNYAEGM